MEAMLARDLKAWQRAFRAEHGREPSKKDMAQHPEIADTYSTWSAIRAATAKPAARASRSSSDKAQRPARSSSSSAAAAESSRTGAAAASTSSLPPVTPTKKRRPQAAAPRTPAAPQTPSAAAAAPARSPFRTPSRPRSAARPAVAETSAAGAAAAAAAAPAATPKRNPFASPARNPFATPSRAAVPPRTPGSAESERSVVHFAGLTPRRSPASPGDAYEAVRSPAALRSLLASRSPGGGSNSRRRAEMARTEAALRMAYTPRTKARKRLRGEDVPPTPARAPKRGRGSETLSVAVEANESSGGGWTRTASGSQSLSQQQPASPQDDEMFGPSPVKRGLKAYKPLLPSRPSSSAAADAMEEDSGSDDLDDESGDLVAGPLSSTVRSEARPPGEPGAAPLQDEQPATPPRRERHRPKAERQRVELDDEDEEGAEAQELIIRPYQRYGAVRTGLQGEESDDSSSDSDGDAAFSHLYAGGRRRRRHGLEAATPPPPDSPAATSTQRSSEAPGLDRLTLASPQTKHARAYLRAREAEALERLLGGGAETLELEAEQAPVEPEGGSKKAKSWGEAKAREQVSKGKGRKKRYDASPPPERSAAQQRAALEARAAAEAPTKLSREGRAGVGDAEQTVRRRPVVYAQRVELDSEEEDEAPRRQAPDLDGDDEDWASEVSSTEFGLGDGEMEETDII